MEVWYSGYRYTRGGIYFKMLFSALFTTD